MLALELMSAKFLLPSNNKLVSSIESILFSVSHLFISWDCQVISIKFQNIASHHCLLSHDTTTSSSSHPTTSLFQPSYSYDVRSGFHAIGFQLWLLLVSLMTRTHIFPTNIPIAHHRIICFFSSFFCPRIILNFL